MVDEIQVKFILNRKKIGSHTLGRHFGTLKRGERSKYFLLAF